MLRGRRKEIDITQLLIRGFKVMGEDMLDTFEVVFHGSKLTPYEGGVWKIRVDIPLEYPFEPPKLSFVNPIFHPNIDFISGLICSDCLYWDEIDHGWSPVYDLVSIFQYWIPRLLFDPNLITPENCDAAELLKHDEGEYKKIVREFCEMCANVEGMQSGNLSGYEDSGSEEYISEEGSEKIHHESP